tara:strand:+ start:750 stop:2612 length:1863 start_codon:yes stop_codon:yes gene_type:complete
MIADIYNRPMFQNPQQRAGGGIMAGVAPINQFMGPMRLEDGGDPGIMDMLREVPGAFYDEISGINLADDFFNLQKTEAGSGINARDITNFLIIDPDDPVDVAIASISAGLIGFPPAAIAAQLARLGYKGIKVKKVLDKVENVQNTLGASSDAGRLEKFARNRIAPGEGAGVGDRLAQIGTNRALGILAPETAMAEEEIEIPLEDVGSPHSIRGIAKIATNIGEARDMKAPTFMRDDKELAAVTAEDVEKSGLGSLRAYLNAMDFDEDLGEYIKKVEDKAAGGIMKLNTGKAIDLGAEFLGKVFKRIEEAVKKGDSKALDNLREEAEFVDLDPKLSGELVKRIDDAAEQIGKKGDKPEGPGPLGNLGDEAADEIVESGTETSAGLGSRLLKRTAYAGIPGAAVFYGLSESSQKQQLEEKIKELEETLSTNISPSETKQVAEQLARLRAENERLNALIEERNNTESDANKRGGNILERLTSKLRNLDPQKGLYIASQMMKPTEGIVPVNAFTQAVEAGMAYDKIQSDQAKDAAAIDQSMLDVEREFNLRKTFIERQTGTALNPAEENELLQSIFQDSKDNATLVKMLATAPDIIDENTQSLFRTDNADSATRKILMRYQSNP